MTESGSVIVNTGSVFSEPAITVYGSGEITLMVGTTIVELTGISDSIVLDTTLHGGIFGYLVDERLHER